MNTKYKITDELALVEFAVDPEVAVINENLHNIMILDVSGSMGYILSNAIDDLKKRARMLKPGDALSFAIFSSKGDFRFVIKMYQIIDEKSFDALDKLFDGCKRTRGLTCFSEVLTDANQVIKDAEFLGMKTSVMFFSDGMPNHPSYTEEVAKVRLVLPEMSKNIDMFLAVAYGNYADRDLLQEMAELAGGESVGSNSLESFAHLMDGYMRATETLTPRTSVKIDIPKEEILSLFAFGDDAVNSFVLKDDGTVQSNKAVFALVKGEGHAEPSNTQLYALALVLSKKGKVDVALEVLNKLGDKLIIDKMFSARTPAERGLVEEKIKDAIFNEDSRFLDGKVENYLPNPNAFCILDLVDLLLNDDKARFYPRHPEFNYNRIGVQAVVRDGYPKFNAYLENSCGFDKVTWHSKFLNLSIDATIKGTVKLLETATGYESEVDEKGKTIRDEDGKYVLKVKGTYDKPKELGDIKETYQFRKYTLIKDGFLNIQKLPISASEATILKLRTEGLIDGDFDFSNADVENHVFVLDLTQVPTVNKKVAETEVSANEMLKLVLEENALEAEQKVLNALRKEVAPDAAKVDNGWSEEVRNYLLALGFTENGDFSPPSDKAEGTDQYEAVSFDVRIKGLSSFPSINDVRKKEDAIKTAMTNAKKTPEFTLSQGLMYPTLVNFDAQVKSAPLEDQVDWIDSRLKAVKSTLIRLRSRIQRLKFALFLGRKWFSDLEQADAEQTVSFTAPRLGDTDLTGIIQVRPEVVKV